MTTDKRRHPAMAEAARLVAVIEMGTTSIRMAIAQISPSTGVTTLDTLQQAVTIGKDTFTKGFIEQDTTEECVGVLLSFAKALSEYRIPPQNTMAIATSAVREAVNRDAFLDRLYIATGIAVNPVDEAEVNRFTYLAVRMLLRSDPTLRRSSVLVTEVGGGSTEVLVFNKRVMGSSHTYRLGSLRLRKNLEVQGASVKKLHNIIQSHVDLTVAHIAGEMSSIFRRARPRMLALGGDARFAASVYFPDWKQNSVQTIPVSDIESMAHRMLTMPVDDIVRRHRISYPSAETLGPALLIYSELAKALNIPAIAVGGVSLRDGALAEMAMEGAWTPEMSHQVVNSALETGRKYSFDETHASYVADLAGQIFQFLEKQHLLSPKYEVILTVAALLHDVGLYISNRSHHKHSMYLIRNSEIFGLSRQDLDIVALIARYHRRGLPQSDHEYYGSLDRQQRVIVSKLAAILRVADAIGIGRVLPEVRLNMEMAKGLFIIEKPKGADAELIEVALRNKGTMFERVYGARLLLRDTPL